MILYDKYNREERAICSHLFRLLHEGLDQGASSPLGQMLKELFKKDIEFEGKQPTISELNFDRVAIFCEASIIRDAYHYRKDDPFEFLDNLTKLIMKQEMVETCKLYSELDERLWDVKKTHPKQIKHKAESLDIQLTPEEKTVYGAMQGMFNAKPDLVIIVDDFLFVCEAKHTLNFDNEQMQRTWNIAEVWAKILHKDLGFMQPPSYTVFKLGAGRYGPDVSWEFIRDIASKIYPENDRSRIAIEAGVEVLKYGLQAFHNKSILLPRSKTMMPEKEFIRNRYEKFLKVG